MRRACLTGWAVGGMNLGCRRVKACPWLKTKSDTLWLPCTDQQVVTGRELSAMWEGTLNKIGRYEHGKGPGNLIQAKARLK